MDFKNRTIFYALGVSLFMAKMLIMLALVCSNTYPLEPISNETSIQLNPLSSILICYGMNGDILYCILYFNF